MPEKPKRTYNTEGRQAQAAKTRSRILAVARELFETEGFEGVTIEQLARAAEVSGPTIYALFQSKRGVLRALMLEALPTDQRLALVEELMHETSAEQRLRLAAKLARQIYDAERTQMSLFRGASVLAPEFKELEKEREDGRYERQYESAKILVQESVLAHGLNLTKVRDIGWALTGRDLYRMLVVERGWTSDEYEQWLGNLLIQTLLGTDSSGHSA